MTLAAHLLDVQDLHVSFNTRRGPVVAVAGISLQVAPAEVLAVVGESGCGKSVTAMSIMGLLDPRKGRISQGQVLFDGHDLDKASRRQLDQIRGHQLAMIFQDPMTSLNPVLSIGRQLIETLRRHLKLDAEQARTQALSLLEEVGIPAQRLDAYPHELSGGMCQRVMIALAISCNPRLLIADEPTTALDVTVQKQVLDLLDRLRRQRDMAMLLITHDLGVVAGYADRAVVMYLGQLVEQAPVNELFAAPAHPYTRALLNAMPDIDQQNARLPSIAGSVPDLHERPVGCAFAPRCEYADARCREQPPQAVEITPGRAVRCWKPLNETQA